MANSMGQQAEKIKILFVAANPLRSRRLQLDEEIREIDEKIRQATYRDSLQLLSIWATRDDNLVDALNRYTPHIVHFSSHGNVAGDIILFDQSGLPKAVNPHAIRNLFMTMKDNIRLVVFNTCHSEIQARAVTEVIDCAIGMKHTIGDRAAIRFAATVYRAIGYGRSIQNAFDQGLATLALEGLAGANTPELVVKRGVDPSNMLLVPLTTEGENFLKRGSQALLNREYPLARQELNRAIREVDQNRFPREAARVRYLLALTLMEGNLPRTQGREVMKSVEGLLEVTIMLHRSYAYYLAFALIKYNFITYNGLQYRINEVSTLIHQANAVAQTTEDEEIMRYLRNCQPHLPLNYQEY